MTENGGSREGEEKDGISLEKDVEENKGDNYL